MNTACKSMMLGAAVALSMLFNAHPASADWIPVYVGDNIFGGPVYVLRQEADQVFFAAGPTPAANAKFVLFDIGAFRISDTSGRLGDQLAYRFESVLVSSFTTPPPVTDDPRIPNLEIDYIGSTTQGPNLDLGTFSLVPTTPFAPGALLTYAGQARDAQGSIVQNIGTVQTSVPEPATLGILALALMGLGFMRRNHS